ncbi:hypothetical protein, partial [Mesorhizobium sp. SARCC-RB16n]|uniref:hypothetical protein n=1 Tax=Mesorhizobium sp. SARCC-RB16n TaxID=2116687 RepID=UPI001AEEC0F1
CTIKPWDQTSNHLRVARQTIVGALSGGERQCDEDRGCFLSLVIAERPTVIKPPQSIRTVNLSALRSMRMMSPTRTILSPARVLGGGSTE